MRKDAAITGAESGPSPTQQARGSVLGRHRPRRRDHVPVAYTVKLLTANARKKIHPIMQSCWSFFVCAAQ